MPTLWQSWQEVRFFKIVTTKEYAAHGAIGIFWSAKDQCHRQIDIGLSPQEPEANPVDVPHVTVDEPLNDPNGGD